MFRIVSKSVNWSRKFVSNPLQSVHSWKTGAAVKWVGGSAPPTSSARGVTRRSRMSAYGSVARFIAPVSGGRGTGDSELAGGGGGRAL